MKAITVIGYHHTGKTTAVTAIIRALCSKGYSVNSIKDIHSEAFRADDPSKNTGLHALAGSQRVFAKGIQDSALIFPKTPDLAEILPLMSCDYLIIEGMKTAALPKIVCAETEAQLDELIDDTCVGISGMIASKIKTYKGLPVFCLQTDMPALMEVVEQKSFAPLPDVDPKCCMECSFSCYDLAGRIVQGLAQRSDCVMDSKKLISLKVNGNEIAIVPFVQRLLADIIRSFVANLKGVDANGDIEIKL